MHVTEKLDAAIALVLAERDLQDRVGTAWEYALAQIDRSELPEPHRALWDEVNKMLSGDPRAAVAAADDPLAMWLADQLQCFHRAIVRGIPMNTYFQTEWQGIYRARVVRDGA